MYGINKSSKKEKTKEKWAGLSSSWQLQVVADRRHPSGRVLEELRPRIASTR